MKKSPINKAFVFHGSETRKKKSAHPGFRFSPTKTMGSLIYKSKESLIYKTKEALIYKPKKPLVFKIKPLKKKIIKKLTKYEKMNLAPSRYDYAKILNPFQKIDKETEEKIKKRYKDDQVKKILNKKNFIGQFEKITPRTRSSKAKKYSSRAFREAVSFGRSKIVYDHLEEYKARINALYESGQISKRNRKLLLKSLENKKILDFIINLRKTKPGTILLSEIEQRNYDEFKFDLPEFTLPCYKRKKNGEIVLEHVTFKPKSIAEAKAIGQKIRNKQGFVFVDNDNVIWEYNPSKLDYSGYDIDIFVEYK